MTRALRPLVSFLVAVASLLLLASRAAQADDATAAEALRTAGAKVTLTKDLVTGCDIPDCSLEKFPAANWEHLSKLAGLKALSFGSGLTDEMLAKLPVLPKLERFGTNAMHVTDEGLKPLAKQTTLTSVAFFHPPKHFTGVGLVHLAPLTNLQSLTVAGSLAFGDEGLAAVGQLKGLKNFRTWHAGGTDEGLKPLASLTQLESLVLGQRLTYKPPASPSDASIDVLLTFPALKTLDLQEARLSPAALTKLKGLKTLKTLKLTGVDLPAEGLEQVKQELGGVEVTWTQPNEVYQKRIKALFDAK